MLLQERLSEDLKTAMRQHDDVRRSIIRLIRSAIHNVEISQKETLDDDGVITVLFLYQVCGLFNSLRTGLEKGWEIVQRSTFRGRDLREHVETVQQEGPSRRRPV